MSNLIGVESLLRKILQALHLLTNVTDILLGVTNKKEFSRIFFGLNAMV